MGWFIIIIIRCTEYIVCINEVSEKQFAIVAVQPLIGEVIFDSFKDDISRQELETRLLYLRPVEVIVITNGNSEQISGPTLMTLKLINHNCNIIHKSDHRVKMKMEMKMKMKPLKPSCQNI